MINLQWVKDYIDIDEDLKDLAVKITRAGINIEKIISSNIDNLVIGKVEECISHPDSDHLHICQVNIGKEIIQIVCGASNVKEGIKVIVALPGALLPGDFLIKKGKIRGAESNGMICALFELGLEEKTEENYNKGIEILSSDAPVGENPLTYLGFNDTVYELDIHKHKNNDCYYHIGFAYEIGAIIDKKVKLPKIDFKEEKENIKDYVNLKVETDKCPYYLAKMVKDIEIKPSPEFIQKRLLSVGMRPINNVVDISNYVMLEFGQPMHFFDYDKLGNQILVRDAKEKETIVTLDGQERTLSKDDIVITDGKNPVCIAGVMGGENTTVDDNTKTIVIESAIFNASNIRRTSSNLKLRSEASIRYEKGLNYEYTDMALSRACQLLEKYACASVLSGTLKHDKVDKSVKKVSFVKDDVNKMLGIDISTDDMKKQLTKLGFEYVENNSKFDVTIPNRRLDIEANVNDIAEEIGRLYGYHNLASTLPKVFIKKGEYIGNVKYIKSISHRLRSLRLNECKTYTLISPDMASMFNYEEKENIVLPNAMSTDKSVIRTSILSSLMNTYNYNKARGVKDIMLYEISKTYDADFKEETKIAVLMKGNYVNNLWQNNKITVDFYLIKGVIENLLDYLGFKNRYSLESDSIKGLHPGIGAKILLDRQQIGVIGKVHPVIEKDDVFVFEVSMDKLIDKKIKPIKYKSSNKYPSIAKDVAFAVDKSTTNRQITDVIRKSGGRLLKEIEVFDLYTGDKILDNEKSIAYSLKFEDDSRTLTEEEVLEVFNKIIKDVTEQLCAKVRDK